MLEVTDFIFIQPFLIRIHPNLFVRFAMVLVVHTDPNYVLPQPPRQVEDFLGTEK